MEISEKQTENPRASHQFAGALTHLPHPDPPAAGRNRKLGLVVHEFPFEELVACVTESKATITCPLCQCTLGLDELCPDIAFSHFPGLKFSFEDITECSELGSGSAAVVLKALFRKPTRSGRISERVVAVKKLKTEVVANNTEVFSEFRREVWLMASLSHPNLVRLFGLCLDPMAMMLEYMDGGDLQSHLLDLTRELDWNMKILLALDIASGMHFLHSRQNPIVHRDLKSPNVLLRFCPDSNRLVAKISDFGLSHALAFTESVIQREEEGCENCIWHAPEVILEKRYDTRTDVYAFGIMMWELAARARPFAEIGWMWQVEDHVKAGGRLEVDSSWIEPYVRLMERCWGQNPAERPPFRAILQKLQLISEFL